MVENRPSKKQRELLSFIDGFIKGNGYGPSYREIMRALDYKSVSTVAVHIDGLIKRGLLYKKDNSARTLEVVKEQMAEPRIDEANEKMHRMWLVEMVTKKLAQVSEVDNKVNRNDIAILIEALRILGYKKDHATLREQFDTLNGE
jgi:repressor LexA